MSEFTLGERVVSDRYGPGMVTGESSKVRDGILVRFSAEEYDHIYNRFTGKRLPLCGSDTITREATE